MQLSALLALLPLAAALPQARGPAQASAVEIDTRDSNESTCYAAYDRCCHISFIYQGEAKALMEQFCRPECKEALVQCKANQTEKRSVEEAPVEARDINVDKCYANYLGCLLDNCPFPELDEFVPKGPCHSKCNQEYEQCKANQTEKRSVEEAPVEARDSDEDSCEAAYGHCCNPHGYTGEAEGLYLTFCSSRCKNALKECKANQTEKRSVEDTLIQARDNHAGDVTNCYGDLADCKHKGGSVEKCYGALRDCLWTLYYKSFA
ncbi:uncharacterized protein Triagg1_2073 [Trichoderma aggressivum f. europaeum]|uniref:Uncharacterized protein n=1 Tax=Trichoderma aggressivum f. europaeum TaxID=173218 RepID=A0AAE1M3G9_9HYPO|nr:hypothetical protein Triagg1_2073 [Trichoderma aggressivum f. europaeum]